MNIAFTGCASKVRYCFREASVWQEREAEALILEGRLGELTSAS